MTAGFAAAAALVLALGGTAPFTLAQSAEPLVLTAGKSQIIESPVPIERISVGYGDVAEASAASMTEVLVNAKTPGVTSLIIWLRGGGKMLFDVTVRAPVNNSPGRIAAIEEELKRELPGQKIELTFANDTVFLHGDVKDLVSADRAVAIASTLGRTVNLLNVDVPAAEQQILLKVRFATIDRTASLDLGLNLVSTGAGNTTGSISTTQFSGPQIVNGANGSSPTPTLSDALNLFFLRPDLNLMGTIQALQRKSLMETLAEPNLLAMNGKQASFLAGGEFPYPTFQAGSNGIGSVTIQFREFGVRLNFTPTITPRGTVRLLVAPEVSALDFTNGLVVQGFTVPALTMRRVNTEIELAPGQSFAIGGLIDNSLTETVAKIPVLGDVPVLGKLFQSKSRLKENTELIVIVTPELVAPVKAGQIPVIKYPTPPGLPQVMPAAPNAPAADGAPVRVTIPVETLIKSLSRDAAAPQQPIAPAATFPAPVPTASPPAK